MQGVPGIYGGRRGQPVRLSQDIGFHPFVSRQGTGSLQRRSGAGTCQLRKRVPWGRPYRDPDRLFGRIEKGWPAYSLGLQACRKERGTQEEWGVHAGGILADGVLDILAGGLGKTGAGEKAAASGKCAKLWLFMALHFVCALRKADMERLPAPALCGDREAVRRSILAGSFTDQEAQGAADGWLFLIDTLEMVPSKTGRYAGVPAFKIFIPTSLGFEGQLCDQ